MTANFEAICLMMLQWSHGLAAVETAGPDLADSKDTGWDHRWNHPVAACVRV